MRILWLSHLVPYPPKAGVIQRSYHLLKQLSRDNQVDLLAFNQVGLMRPIFPDIQQGLREAQRELSTFCRIRGIFAIPCDTRPYGRHRLALRSLFHGSYTTNWLISAPFRQALASCLADTDYDLVHMDTLSFAPYYPMFRHKLTVLDHHNIESHMMFRRAEQEGNWLKRHYFRLEGQRLATQEQTLCPAVDLNITCSDVDSQRLRESCQGASVVTVPNGVDTAYFQPDRQPLQTSLLFIGSMGWYPNIQAVQFMIERLAAPVREAFPELTIDIIGGGAPEWLKASARDRANVRFHGFVDDIRPCMNRALAFVCPITDGGGTKLKILDALAMGIPIIAHPIACEGIDVVDGKSALFATDADHYLTHLAGLMRDEHLRNTLSRQGRLLAEEKYSTDAVGKILRDSYDALRAS